MNWSALEVAEVPPGVVTVTSTVAVDSAGLTAVISVEETSTTLVAPVDPKSTSAGEVKLLPVIVTVLPPAVDPEVGLTVVTAGAATYVNSSADEVELVPWGVVTVTFTVPDPAGLRAMTSVAD